MAMENGIVLGPEKKRKHKNIDKKLLVGDKVEVRSVENGHEHSWHPGTVIATEDQARSVRYEHRLCINGSKKLISSIKVPPIIDGLISASKIHHSHRGSIRPLPPQLNADETTFHYGQCVDAYYDEAWWEGVIFDGKNDSKNRLIFFPDTCCEMHIMSNNLRITQDWDAYLGHWRPRKNWFFLELIEEFKQEWPLLVSVKQIWFDVKGKTGFQKQLKSWSSVQYSLWRNLVWEAFSDTLKLVLRHFFKEANLLEEEDQQSPLLFSEASFVDILKPKPHSNSSYEELVCSAKTPSGRPKCVYKKRKDMWLPASSDIVPGPEFCPDSVNELIHIYKCKKRPSPELRLSVRKHLLFLGWNIEFMRVRGTLNFLYTSPKGRRHYDSLLKVCESLNGEYSGPNSESINEELSCNGKKKRYMWAPAGPRLVPKAEFCPDAIQKYSLLLGTGKRPEISLILDVRKHLSFLGWRIEFMRYKGAQKMRYISPEGTSYESLPKALQSEAADIYSVPYQSKENILPEYCPEAIEQYFLLSSVERGKYGKVFEEPKNKEIKIKAKKHLAALGWSFCVTTRGKYTSKGGKKYYTLRAACKGCIDEGAVNETNALIPVVEQSMIVEENENEKKSEETLEQLVLNSKSDEVAVKSKHQKVTPKVIQGRKKTVNSVLTLDSHLFSKKGKNVEPKHLKKRKKGQSVDCPNRGLRSCKRFKKGLEDKLSWLMETNVVSPGDKVHYVSKEDNSRIGEGMITRDGIKCICCLELFTLSNFELHVCNNNPRSEGTSILEDGRSLSDCELQLKCFDNDKEDPEKSDYICSICCYGGKLILCDQCPSAFHTKCLGLQCVPEGDWFCPSCCCGICDDCKFASDTKEFGDENVLSCDQCEHKYHVGCVRHKDVFKLEDRHNENWFCGERCEQIFLGLQKVLGKPVPVGEENITWTLSKYLKNSDCDVEVSTRKLNDAISVMHECFEPSMERKTRRDVVEDVIFSRWSELNRLNFQGFYTVLLEKNDEVVAVAALRIYGEKVAELPLIGTRAKYRRLGMCRILMNELEKKLSELGVERLVLPAVPSVLNTWTESFGFSKMSVSERLNFLDYTFLDFEGTIMCQKLLKDIPSPCLDHLESEQTLTMVSKNRDSDEISVASEVVQADPVFSINETDSVLPIYEENPVCTVDMQTEDHQHSVSPIYEENPVCNVEMQTNDHQSEANQCPD